MKNNNYTIDGLLTVEQLASKLGVAVSTIRLWRYKRRISFTRLGRRLYVAAGVVDKLLAENVIPALPASREPNSNRPAGQGGAQTEGGRA
jgi:excisionase family DNA binding protein